MIRVGYIAGEPTPSRVPHLERIAARPELELTVIYAAGTVQRRNWTLTLPTGTRILRGPSLPAMRVLHHDYPLTPQIWSLLQHERFDVLVIGGWSLLATQLAVVWARLHSVPYLMISENHLREDRPAWVRAVKTAVLRHVIPQANAQLVTGTLAAEHAMHYGAARDRIVTFPNTVDVEAFAEAAHGLEPRRAEIRRGLGFDDDNVVVAHVARLLASKGVGDAVEAAGAAVRAGAANLRLLLVGDGPERGALERRAAEVGADVTFAGFRQGEALLECYAAADIFALLSHRETWGIVVNEAAAFALPLVLSDAVGAAEDLLHPGENGELVPARNPHAAAEAFVRLAADPELRGRYGRLSAELVVPWGYEASVDAFVTAVQRAYSESRTVSAQALRTMRR